MVKKCGDCIHANICKELNGGWFSPKNPAYCTAFKERTNFVEVVRCKDCRYFYRDDEFNRAWCGYDKCVANEVAVNGYCYRGERKDNDKM